MIDDKKLKEVLNEKLALIRGDSRKSVIQDISDWMANNYNVQHGETVHICNGYTPVESLPYHMLYKLMKSVKNACSERYMEIDLSGLSEDMYFTQQEKKEYSKKVVAEKFDKDIIIKKGCWVQENQNKFFITILASDWVKWKNSGKARYNPETQRDLVEVSLKDGVKYLRLNINKESIRTMYDLLLENKYDGDAITLNANTDINTSSDMLPRIAGDTFVIPKKCILDLLDGWHRGEAIYDAKVNNEDWDYQFGVYITLKNTEQANDFIFLQDKKNHLEDKQAERIDVTDKTNTEVNYIIDSLKGDSQFHIGKLIDINTKSELNIIIKDIFAPKNRETSYPIYSSIKKNINELVQEKGYFNRTFCKEEWMIYLYFIKEIPDNFINIVENIDIDNLIKEMSYKNKPLPSGYKKLDNIINEVKENGNK